MVLNCDPLKTELICFGTAEKKPGLIPQHFKIGDNTIYFVEKTKVLGLIVDCNLSYIEHGKEINRKLLHRWSKICKHSNRNWGFKQHVTVRLTETIISSCIQYAGIVWLNWRSIKEVEVIWYKIIKSAIGAVFNVRKSLSETIVGVPPMTITNRINTTKHFLKLNICSIRHDAYKEFLQGYTQTSTYGHLITKIKEVFIFLKWKMENYRDSILDEVDKTIVQASDISSFVNLSAVTCGYTKEMMDSYTVHIWQESINREYQADGFPNGPKVSVAKLVFSPSISRTVETVTLSLFYPNNLLNAFLHRFDNSRYTSPLCACKTADQDGWHILMECPLLNRIKQAKIKSMIISNNHHGAEFEVTHLLVSWLRTPSLLTLAAELTEEALGYLRTEIVI